MQYTTFNSTVFRRIIRESIKRERDIGTGLNIDSERLIFVLGRMLYHYFSSKFPKGGSVFFM